MALSGNFSLQSVSIEFGDNTRPSPRSLTNFYSKIFGSAGSGSRLSDFNGYGKPSLSNFEADTRSTSGGGWVDLEFHVTNHNLPTNVRIEYHETDGNPPFTGQPTSISSSTEWYSSSGTKTLAFQVNQADTEYAFRARGFNEFNDGSTSDYVASNSDTATTSSGDSSGGDDPTNVTNIQLVNNFGSGLVELSFNYTETGHTSFQVQHSWDGGSWISGNISNLSSSGNSYQANFSPDNLNAGNEIQYRIRGNSSESWAVSNTYSA